MITRLHNTFVGAGTEREKAAVEALRTKGYHVVPDFIPAEKCAAVIEHLDRLFVRFPDKVQHEQAEGTSGDYRVFGAEHDSTILQDDVAGHPMLRRVGTTYLNEDVITHFVLGNKVEYTPGQICNSGAGWHRDSKNRQFKAIVYLTDVESSNAPFTIVAGSWQVRLPARDGARTQNRFDDDTVDALVRRHGMAVEEITGRAGTCILVDTSNIHRGKDIQSGVRYAVTNYYFENTAARRESTQAKWGQYLLHPVT